MSGDDSTFGIGVGIAIGLVVIALIFGVMFILKNTPGLSPENEFGDTASCTDSDGGAFAFKFGNVWSVKDGKESIFTDSCSDSSHSLKTSGPFVLEYFCTPAGPRAAVFSCKDGCSRGVCLS